MSEAELSSREPQPPLPLDYHTPAQPHPIPPVGNFSYGGQLAIGFGLYLLMLVLVIVIVVKTREIESMVFLRRPRNGLLLAIILPIGALAGATRYARLYLHWRGFRVGVFIGLGLTLPLWLLFAAMAAAASMSMF